MPREYSCYKKAAALIQLERNGGDIPLTAQQTGISERSFHAWKRSILPHLQQYPPPPQQKEPELPPFEDDLEMLSFIREQIMQELLRLSLDIGRTSHITTPYQRAVILSQLMDRLMKLDEHLKPYEPPPVIRVSWTKGIYVRTQEGYHGPFYPDDLPKRWKELFGEDSTLEIYWGDLTASLLPEGIVRDTVLQFMKIDWQTQKPLLTPDGQDIEWDKLTPPEPGEDVYADYRYQTQWGDDG